ncbi:hypothetical protein BGX38DRAFT_228315 [Terfezia claveryi]|nr:hypothetical protein BGX38DRAFT_228315 [Terfezia claveryi]
MRCSSTLSDITKHAYQHKRRKLHKLMKSPLYLAMLKPTICSVTTIVSSDFAADFRWTMKVEIDSVHFHVCLYLYLPYFCVFDFFHDLYRYVAYAVIYLLLQFSRAGSSLLS